MDNKNKDKIIVGLIIALVVLFANNLNNRDSLENKFSLFNQNEELLINESVDTIDNPEEKEEIKVHISGEVNQEGVYTVKDGDRLDDLVKIAGGFTDIANKKDLNLALRLTDQMKVYVPSIYEESSSNENSYLLFNESPNTDGLININTASKDELMTLPNIGDKRAQSIIDYREVNPFTSIEDIKNVTGIGDKFYEALKDLITV